MTFGSPWWTTDYNLVHMDWWLPLRRVCRERMLVGCQLLVLCVAATGVCRAQTPVCSYEVINTFPHDDGAYTQGLLYEGGELFESTGLYGESSLRRVVLETGQVLQITQLDSGFFGEGLAKWGDQFLQLTWQGNTCFIWDDITFAPQGTFSYSGEGWGLTHDGRRLIMSDGTSSLRFRDPGTFDELDTRLSRHR